MRRSDGRFLYRTTDAGAQVAPAGPADLAGGGYIAVSFVSAGTGCVVTEAGYLLRTDDGGATLAPVDGVAARTRSLAFATAERGREDLQTATPGHNARAAQRQIAFLVALPAVGSSANPRSLGPARIATAAPAASPVLSVSREQAIEAALDIARSPQVEISPAQVPPRNVEAKLTTRADARRRVEGIDATLADADVGRPVWLVTMEGLWRSGFLMPTGVPTPEPYPRHMVVLDAMTGEQLMVAAQVGAK